MLRDNVSQCGRGLRVSWPKTKAMHIGDGPSPPPLCIGNDTVEFVDSFLYLGSLVTSSGDLKPEIDRKRGIAATAIKPYGNPCGAIDPSQGGRNLGSTILLSCPYCYMVQKPGP